MASQGTIRQGIRRIAETVGEFASTHGWQPDDYRLYVNVDEDWGQIGLILVARAFPGKTDFDQWLAVLEFLRDRLRDDPPLMGALHLSILTFDQVEEGGLYGIPESFLEVNEYLTGAQPPIRRSPW